MSAISEARDLIGALLPDDDGWHPAAPIYAAAAEQGVAERTLRRAAVDLGIEHERLRTPRAPVMWRWTARVDQPLRSVAVADRDFA